MRVRVFEGDIADAPAEAVCTSTNARLSLMMGSGGSVRERGGFVILRECEQILEQNGGKPLPPGSVHVTTAGTLPYKLAIHCVASDPASHLSSAAIIRACVRNALAAADRAGARTVAMPVFATGHARFKFAAALEAIAEGLREAEADVDEVVIAVPESEHAAAARRVFS